jgi:glucosamine--fructose-6-phosphate aminotransferase (isomerizing)
MSEPDFLTGVRSQPYVLARSAATVREALAGPAGDAAVRALGGGRVAAVGMGASTHAVTAFAAWLRAAGRPALAFSAAELSRASGDMFGGTPADVPAGLADAFLAVSQSGRSRETVEAMRAVSPGVPRVAVTDRPDQPLGAAADVVLPLGSGEDTRVSTLSYTATVQALGLLADALTGSPSADWAALPGLARSVLAADTAAVFVDAFADVSVIDVVGSGIAAGSVGAAALLLREAVHLPTAGYPTREYLHGPLEAAGAGRGALVFGTGREAELAADLASWGASVVLVTTSPAPPEHRRLRVVTLPAAGGLAAAVLDILPVQLASAALAARKGLTIALHHMPDDTKLSS